MFGKGDYVQAFRSSKDVEVRLSIIMEWLMQVLKELQITDPIIVFKMAEVYSKKFTTRPIMKNINPDIDWFLSDTWLRELVAQMLIEHSKEPTIKFYARLKWNYKASINPTPTSQSTVQKFDISDLVPDSPVVKLTLTNRNQLKLGSLWRNKNSSENWEITGASKGIYELSSINYNLINYRKVFTITNNYVEVV